MYTDKIRDAEHIIEFIDEEVTNQVRIFALIRC